ncbi:nitroreductase family protein [bacterium]
MNIFQNRYSVRKYDSRAVEREKIDEMIQAAHIAPSSCNSQPWRYIVVDEPNLLEELKQKGLGILVPNHWAKSAPCMIAACCDEKMYVHKLAAFFKDVDYALLDMGASIENMLLKAADLGLGTCWIGWFNEKNIKKLFNIPKGIKVVSLITLGYPHPDLEIRHPEKLPISQILAFNSWIKKE